MQYFRCIDTSLRILQWIAAALFTVSGIRAWLGGRQLQRLPPPSSASVTDTVSVIVAARDEAARIETTVRRLLDQRGVRAEVTVVDDRSTDATTSILQRLARADDRLQVERIEALPDGWLGKCHACHIGARRAQGDWLLFVDGDSWLEPDAIARALHAAADDAAVHVTLMASMARCTLLGRALVALLSLGFLQRIGAINRDRGLTYVGAGAFNLFRADAYRAIGGHERVRMDVIEDMRLAENLRRAGYRSRVYAGSDACTVDWVADLGSFFRVLEKNLFAALRFRTALALTAATSIAALWLVAILGTWTGTAAGVAASLALATLIPPAWAVSRAHGWSPLSGVLAPLMVPFVAAALVRSTVVTVARGGIAWRGTFHSLAELRAAARR